MSQQQNFTKSSISDSPVSENVFEELDQELRRLKSAVSHLSLSESAATQAIEAAERVVVQQGQLHQQLTEYLNHLPERQAAATSSLVAELSQAVATQQQQDLAQMAQQLKQGHQELAAHLKSALGSRQPESMIAEGIQATLKQQFQQLQSQLQLLLEPSTKPKAPLPSTLDYEVRNKVDELSKKVNELTQLAAAQQRMLKWQRVVGLITLLGVLAMLTAGFIKG
ncbi:hypothetical protein [Hymenobacter actinosclerus]|uniref:Uncharacterized protein n=1 Tax=Hymenobacter actinosclerus TaxID=82805 RepID=A0A1I0ILC2_9BACT|nr:hypothetical protein [Hymenobacter actinosclerus]SET97853.1 hypothetical protein SAMN04487998_3370 [Hymenobacter actinosclerus]